MNFHETHYFQYLNTLDKFNLHKSMQKYYSLFHSHPYHLIINGPRGIGKYTQSIKFISLFSPSNLRYEKKTNINHDKNEYYFKISDSHIEIDFSVLGCNPKLLWNDIYSQIINIITTNNYHIFFILCKNFHSIHNELHDVFYSYMETTFSNTFNIYFIFNTCNLSFIRPNILNICYIISLPKPSKTNYLQLTNKKNALHQHPTLPITDILSIKSLKSNIMIDYSRIHDTLFSILTSTSVNYIQLRNLLYDMLIYNIPISDTIWYVLEKIFVLYPHISFDIIFYLYKFYWHFNNNYRPIYHLEKFFILLISHINNPNP